MPQPGERRLRVAHLTTVDMSLALLLATELETDREAGFEVFGISAPGPYVAQVEALGVTHLSVPSLTRAWSLRRDLAAAGQLWRVLRRLRPDVLHTHNPKTGVMGRILGRLARIPIVVNTCHGLWARPEDPLTKRAVVYAIEAFATLFSDLELYQNAADRRILARVVPQRRALTVGNGVDLRRFRRDEQGRQRVRAELGLRDNDLLVGGVGRKVAEKGIAEFAAAARALGDQAMFVWVGPDDEDKPDRVIGDVAGVRFLGGRGDMPAVYSAFDVFALPSYREGFSRSAIEAAACGCALVLTDIRGCREIGRHEQELLLVPPGDAAALQAAIGRLLADEALRHRLATAASARAHAAFDQRRVAATSIAAYRVIAERKGVAQQRGLA